jgi:hypothetical protein
VSDPFFLAVGTVPATKNTAQVYFRTQASGLAQLFEYIMMGSEFNLTNTLDASKAISSFHQL